MRRVAVPLRRPPALAQIGFNLHGRRPRERFRFADVWGLHLYDYAGEVRIGGETVAFAPGDITVTPPDVDLEWRFPRSAPHHYALLRFPDAAGGAVELAVLHRLGARREEVAAAFAAAVSVASREPARAVAWVWALLWSLVSAPTPAGRPTCAAPSLPPLRRDDVHPAVQTALALIEGGLETGPSLAGLAHRVGISPNQLLRVFRAHTGRSVMAYVRARRAERARRLLESTALPLREVARRVGAVDLQRLNKLVRAAYGMPPRALRDAARGGDGDG